MLQSYFQLSQYILIDFYAISRPLRHVYQPILVCIQDMGVLHVARVHKLPRILCFQRNGKLDPTSARGGGDNVKSTAELDASTKAMWYEHLVPDIAQQAHLF